MMYAADQAKTNGGGRPKAHSDLECARKRRHFNRIIEVGDDTDLPRCAHCCDTLSPDKLEKLNPSDLGKSLAELGFE